MGSWAPLSVADQFALHLRKELVRGRWGGKLPGIRHLAGEFGVNHKTVRAAVGQLEEEGILVNQGAGRERRVVIPKGEVNPMRIAILPYEDISSRIGYFVDLQHKLVDAGHMVSYASQSLLGMGMNVNRIRRLVEATEADAWLVVAAPGEVLSWFAQQDTPAFALFGRWVEVPIAGTGPDHVPAMRLAVRRLLALGHQRIVMLLRRGQLEQPGRVDSAILEEMEAHGLQTGPYNLPIWENSSEGLVSLLDDLFQITPPSVLIIDEAFLFHAVEGYLAQRGILAPAHVSLVCADPDPTFVWCQPSVAHCHWDPRPVVRNIVRWANSVGRGKKDIRQSFTKAEFVDGGTVGRAPAVGSA